MVCWYFGWEREIFSISAFSPVVAHTFILFILSNIMLSTRTFQIPQNSEPQHYAQTYHSHIKPTGRRNYTPTSPPSNNIKDALACSERGILCHCPHPPAKKETPQPPYDHATFALSSMSPQSAPPSKTAKEFGLAGNRTQDLSHVIDRLD
ncbi:hypothetical protein CC80DRAFT_43952 [Byssothecium circinans]|uniref:Uncharacterized protein n=1 Tax=Byssothecium circinans TaxID=147558 RepID=A0A6A5TYJ0_9PLEO|nr:hypothetical protein CC80DRAFT_43952 [Byssothecium circinans]